MSDAQVGTPFGAGRTARDSAAPDRQLSTTAVLGFAAVIAVALVAGAQWGDHTTPDLAEIERPDAEVSEAADQPVFDGRGKWGGYAR